MVDWIYSYLLRLNATHKVDDNIIRANHRQIETVMSKWNWSVVYISVWYLCAKTNTDTWGECTRTVGFDIFYICKRSSPLSINNRRHSLHICINWVVFSILEDGAHANAINARLHEIESNFVLFDLWKLSLFIFEASEKNAHPHLSWPLWYGYVPGTCRLANSFLYGILSGV